MLASNPENLTEDEREHLLSTVGQAHAGLSEVALKLRLGLPPKTPVLKTAIKAERAAFDLKRSLQRLEVKAVETITRRAAVLPEVRRGGKVVDPASLLRHENRHDEHLTGLPRRNNPRRSVDESFNGTFRDEFLSLQWVRNRMDAKVGIEQWRQHDNAVRPHSSLGSLTPAEFTAQLRAGSDDGGRSSAMPARADQEEHGDARRTSTGAVLQ